MLLFAILDTSSLRSGVSKLRPAGQMRPTKPCCQWWKK